MNNYLTYPSEVIVQEKEYLPQKKALLFAIYPDDKGVPYATCWMIETENWLTCPLAFVKPNITVIRKINLNEKL